MDSAKFTAVKTQFIRNFCIIAHIDHGKSTLADRFLEITHTISDREMKAQVLDDMELERERGITIKSHPIQMKYQHSDGNGYILNLIDTPGHVDFSYEVSRSLAACEGVILLVDAAQGVEAQTVSHAYLAQENNLTIIPVLNKIDLSIARIDVVSDQLMELISCQKDEILSVSAKTGEGAEPLLQAVIDTIPPPSANRENPSRALIFDSSFDPYRGALPYIRVFDGVFKPDMTVQFISTGRMYEITEVGHFQMVRVPTEKLEAGDVGYIVANVKELKELKVGDTITTKERRAKNPLPGYKEIKPMIFSGLFPVNSDDYEHLRTSLEKLRLNDASLMYEPETSAALGFGFRGGFLGLLHMEVVQERLEREFDLELITTIPNVRYEVMKKNGDVLQIDNPSKLPPLGEIAEIREPFIRAEIITPSEYIGTLMKLCQNKRGVYRNTHYFSQDRVQLEYDLPLAEIIYDFYDKLKSVSRGFASFDYEHIGFQIGNLQKLDILINGESVDALSIITNQEDAYHCGKDLCHRLKNVIPRQMFEVVIQAAIGSKIIAREVIKPYRKNVTAKLYGGDITRKRKLRDKQKEGKKRMKQIGRVEVPQEAFLALFQIDQN
ncbi:MAG: elongation factor 4 [Candidatus Marinimicrobia bacterium]|nr:elongation factor 4 [Candidatus Neomarinimicrobiota bacterium]